MASRLQCDTGLDNNIHHLVIQPYIFPEIS